MEGNHWIQLWGYRNNFCSFTFRERGNIKCHQFYTRVVTLLAFWWGMFCISNANTFPYIFSLLLKFVKAPSEQNPAFLVELKLMKMINVYFDVGFHKHVCISCLHFFSAINCFRNVNGIDWNLELKTVCLWVLFCCTLEMWKYWSYPSNILSNFKPPWKKKSLNLVPQYILYRII